MKHLKSISLLIVAFIIATFSADSQNEDDEKITFQNYIGGSIQLKNMHLWRGIEVSDEVSAITDIHFKTKNDAFRAGLWGGVGVNGKFKEFDYYASFKHSGFEISLWDIYNFSTGATYNNKEAFNYKARETGHFIDLRLSHRLQGSFPLKIFWATLLYGRDRDALNKKNRYSSYIELEYPIISHEGYTLDAGIGGAFALVKGRDLNGVKTKAHFYGDEPNIVDIHLRFSKTFKLGDYKLPVVIMPMWNPEKDYMNMEISLELLSF
ncbi:hypothetical protein JGH11_13580 [Dysgonomonas sp. Marseille-P4677]|uniref:hypothetical protein n=1 Tax=Dysgonomonas sp. Marseille-P4677 TaxID=2364790 RepID=UPI001913F530|nr:hypothetical protein [Dysgonomonas sp. Marseille-P4677]MBK5721905.1 hypothetical protein [Dysgonomonas sp. Marseille-P4677]